MSEVVEFRAALREAHHQKTVDKQLQLMLSSETETNTEEHKVGPGNAAQPHR